MIVEDEGKIWKYISSEVVVKGSFIFIISFIKVCFLLETVDDDDVLLVVLRIIASEVGTTLHVIPNKCRLLSLNQTTVNISLRVSVW